MFNRQTSLLGAITAAGIDLQALARRKATYTYNGRTRLEANGQITPIWDHKRHLKPRKVYPYSSTRQNTRQQRKGDRDMLRAMGS